jgi:hypothetical protein
MKTCKKCGVEQLETNFSKGKLYADRLRPWCKVCCKEYMKSYYEANKKTLNKRPRSDQEKRSAVQRSKEWKKANPEKVKINNARYRAKYKEELNARHRERDKRISAENPDYFKNRSAEFRKQNPKWCEEYFHNYRARHKEEASDLYIKRLFNKRLPKERRLYDLPTALIEAKRLQIFINRRIKNENSNTTKK